MLRKFSVLLVANTLLFGCAKMEAQPIAKETKFNPDSGSAIVILGFGCETYLAAHCSIDIHRLIDGKINRQESDHFSIGDRKGFTLITSRDPESFFKRQAFNVTPGEYGILNVTNLHGGKYITSFVKNDNFFIKFKIEPGKINYIGDFYMNARSFPARLTSYKVDTGVTQEYANSFPGVQGDLIVQKLNISLPAIKGTIEKAPN